MVGKLLGIQDKKKVAAMEDLSKLVSFYNHFAADDNVVSDILKRKISKMIYLFKKSKKQIPIEIIAEYFNSLSKMSYISLHDRKISFTLLEDISQDI